MSKNKLKNKIRNLCLAIQICCLLISSGLDMAVLCHADDGRAKIEAANAEGCAELPNHDHTEDSAEQHDAEFAQSKDDCGDCVDVPLSIGRAEAQKKPLKESLATSTLLAGPSNTNADSESHRCFPRLLLPPPCIGPLSSIVLLI